MIELVGVGNITNDPLSDDVYYGQQVPIAIFIFLFSSIFFVFNLIVILALQRDADYRKFIAYRIMAHIGITDTVQMALHFTAGIYILDGGERYRIFEAILGAVMNASWCTMLVLSILLNINRFVSIIFALNADRIFSLRLSKVYIGICWLFFLLIFGIDVSEWSHMYYVVPLFTWHYQDGRLLSHFIRSLSAQLVLAEVIIAIVAYGSIFIYIYSKHAILSKKEMYLTIQVLSMSAFHVLGFLIWEYWFLPDTPLATFFGHFVWMLWNAISPLLHVTISPRIRMDVLNFLGLRKASSATRMGISVAVAATRSSRSLQSMIVK